MSFFGKPIAVAASAVALSGAALAPLGFALAAGAAPAHAAPGPVQVASAPTPLPLPSVSRPAEALVVEQPATPDAGDIQDGDEIATPDTDETVISVRTDGPRLIVIDWNSGMPSTTNRSPCADIFSIL